MDSHRFDHLAMIFASRATRRASLGLFATVGLFGLVPSGEDATAKNGRKGRKKRGKKRKQRHQQDRGQGSGQGSGQDAGQDPGPTLCQQLGVACVAGAAPTCCAGLLCDQTVAAGINGAFCCEPEGTSCTSGESCCSGSCDFLIEGGTCAPCRGRQCNATRPCCGGFDCTNGYCDGCRDRGVSCSSNAQCCYSNCTNGACLSAQGGPCARDADCRACYLGQNCDGACVNGSCAV